MEPITNVNFRMSKQLKQDMEKTCADMGLTMTSAFNIFAKKVTREGRIPFEISTDPFFSTSNIAHLESIAQDIKSDKAHFAEHALMEID